jgi:hypothetical protein
VYGRIPIDVIALKLTIKNSRMLAKLHGVHVPSRAIQSDIVNIFKGHHCSLCDTHVSVLELCKILSNADRCKKQYQKTVDANKSVLFQKKYARRNNVLEKEKQALIEKKCRMRKKNAPFKFPPPPPSTRLSEEIIRNWCEGMSSSNIYESGCAVCGQLTATKNMTKIHDTKCDLSILERQGAKITRLERNSCFDPIEEIEGPVLDAECDGICRCEIPSHSRGAEPRQRDKV